MGIVEEGEQAEILIVRERIGAGGRKGATDFANAVMRSIELRRRDGRSADGGE